MEHLNISIKLKLISTWENNYSQPVAEGTGAVASQPVEASPTGTARPSAGGAATVSHPSPATGAIDWQKKPKFKILKKNETLLLLNYKNIFICK